MDGIMMTQVRYDQTHRLGGGQVDGSGPSLDYLPPVSISNSIRRPSAITFPRSPVLIRSSKKSVIR